MVTPDHVEVDRVGHEAGTPLPAAAKPPTDTLWVADWTFDAGEHCDASGWTTADLIIRNNGELYWQVDDEYAGVGGVEGYAAVLKQRDLCWAYPEGYGNDWYQGIRIPYRGTTLLSFDYIIDSEAGFDALQVETDEACSSYERAMEDPPYHTNSPSYRLVRLWDSGLVPAGRVDSLVLSDYGASADTHCVYLSFYSDGCCAPSDGYYVTPTLGLGLALDNIRLDDAGDPASPTMIVWDEDFEDQVLDPPAFALNMHDSIPYGDWARLFPHATDNDVCAENTTCSWIWTDSTLVADDSRFAFGPEGTVVPAWIDNVIISPWVSLGAPAGSQQTVISFRRFPGSFFSNNRRVQNWSVRGKKRVDNTFSPEPGDSTDCVQLNWGHAFQWNSLSTFRWLTVVEDMSSDIDPDADRVQVRFRVSDWQWISGASPPAVFFRNPGPYVDRVRIGRILVNQPLFSEGVGSWTRAQDAFPTAMHGIPGEHYTPSGERFGTAAFSMSTDVGTGVSPSLIAGDSITIEVLDARDAGGIISVAWHGAIVAGPHAGKAPPPWSVGPDGFFTVAPDTVRDASGTVVENTWSIDLDDDYFRGGDVLHYYWSAMDALGARGSFPEGVEAAPASVLDAEESTGGLLEVSFLPTINWAPSYLSRIQADASGKLTPTAEELAGSEQANCILYTQLVNLGRRSGPLNRTSFMYTLDRIGYAGRYDVYDLNGLAHTNNHLGGRATVSQATGYAILIYDSGNQGAGLALLPDGSNIYDEKVDQAQWLVDWLENAPSSEVGSATLWMIGADLVEAGGAHPLFTQTTRAALVSSQQTSALNPGVVGLGSFVWAHGDSSDFSTDDFYLSGACPAPKDYDALQAVSPAFVSHRFHSRMTLGDAATIMHHDPVAGWNSIVSSFAWADIRPAPDLPQSQPSHDLLQRVVGTLEAAHCGSLPVPTEVEDRIDATPPTTRLLQNAPNPFNPVTTLRFDLAQPGFIDLSIFDISGRRVRQLVHEELPADRYSRTWDGRAQDGRRLASGIYLIRLQTPGQALTRKVMLLK